MRAPAAAAGRFAAACLLGMGLGLLYGFLRPLGRRYRAPADGLFLLAAGGCWLYLSFAVCHGDLRPAYLIGMMAGALVLEMTLGLVLRPVFVIFWEIIVLPLKKISKIRKILFASAEKWVTIRWSNRRHRRHKSGGTPNGKHH